MVFVTYRSAIQTNHELEAVLTNFQKLLNDIINCKPSLSVIQVTLIQDVLLGGLMILILKMD